METVYGKRQLSVIFLTFSFYRYFLLLNEIQLLVIWRYMITDVLALSKNCLNQTIFFFLLLLFLLVFLTSLKAWSSLLHTKIPGH